VPEVCQWPSENTSMKVNANLHFLLHAHIYLVAMPLEQCVLFGLGQVVYADDEGGFGGGLLSFWHGITINLIAARAYWSGARG
jgi:hypothetical protein